MSKDEKFRKKIHDWLDSQGYPLEMQVSLAFKQSGFSVRQSNFYADPETGESREIDVIATTNEEISCTKYVSYVIECKISRDKPWILFTSENVLGGWNIFFTRAIFTEEAKKILIDTFKDNMDDPKLGWLREKLRAGYGLTQAFTSGHDITHDAIMSPSKGAIARKVEMDKNSEGVFEVIFPVIIIDGRLFECFLDNSCSVQVREIEDGVLFAPRSIGGILVSCIRLVTIKSLPEFSRKAYKLAKIILS